MKRTPEVEQVLRVVRRVISRRFANDRWVLVGDPLMQEIDAAGGRARADKGPGLDALSPGPSVFLEVEVLLLQARYLVVRFSRRAITWSRSSTNAVRSL